MLVIDYGAEINPKKIGEGEKRYTYQSNNNIKRMTLKLEKSSYIDASLILVVSIEVTPSGYLRYIYVYVEK